MALCLCSFLASQTSCLSWVLAWGGAWRRTPSVMNHSSTLGGVAMGLSREEKHLPDSQVPQPQETTALEGGDEQTIWGGTAKLPKLPCGPGAITFFLRASDSPAIKERKQGPMFAWCSIPK